MPVFLARVSCMLKAAVIVSSLTLDATGTALIAFHRLEVTEFRIQA